MEETFVGIVDPEPEVDEEVAEEDFDQGSGLDTARVLAHGEDVQHRLLVEIADVFGPASEW